MQDFMLLFKQNGITIEKFCYLCTLDYTNCKTNTNPYK